MVVEMKTVSFEKGNKSSFLWVLKPSLMFPERTLQLFESFCWPLLRITVNCLSYRDYFYLMDSIFILTPAIFRTLLCARLLSALREMVGSLDFSLLRDFFSILLLQVSVWGSGNSILYFIFLDSFVFWTEGLNYSITTQYIPGLILNPLFRYNDLSAHT